MIYVWIGNDFVKGGCNLQEVLACIRMVGEILMVVTRMEICGCDCDSSIGNGNREDALSLEEV